MAKSNIDRIGEALDEFVAAYRPFVEEALAERHGDKAEAQAQTLLRDKARGGVKVAETADEWDVPAIVDIIQAEWQYLFRRKLQPADRSMLFEIKDIRNRWAHRQAFTAQDTLRALDTVGRLLESIKAVEQAERVQKLHGEVMRARFAEMQRTESTRAARTATEGTPQAGLRPWRDVIEPHPDVASGNFTNAEFAADLAQVHRGDASAEYGDPKEFFRRTFLTEGLTSLLENGLKRLSGKGGHPIVDLQTNFGGGKTHSMLALYHLFGEVKAGELAGVEPIMTKLSIEDLPQVRRAILVGTRMSAGQPEVAPDGTELRTMWGRMAWQLGAYEAVGESDRLASAPGSDDLVKLLRAAGPCLILIDEWVAFVREAYNRDDLPIGSFESNLSFVQALTEAVKSVPNAVLVASLPQSKIEVGSEGGQEALASLQSTFARVEFNWRPASQDESYEIVRRRLFNPITDPKLFAARDAVTSAFAELYTSNKGDYPAEASELSYRRRLESAYPIHPELFDRLYNDWSTMEQFQRTRGVLRFMASVIHTLWMRQDHSLTILPSMVPLDEPAVQSEITNYLTSNWPPIIEQDIDGGEEALPRRVDRTTPRFGQVAAARRVARTVFLGSAPVPERANKGVDTRNIRLGSVQPGENAAVFGDALRQLADQANYLYADGSRYWYDTQPNVNRTAADRAHQQGADDVLDEIRRRLEQQKKHRAPFAGVHVCPGSSGDVPDDPPARLVILDPQYTHSKAAGDTVGIEAVRDLLEHRGSSPRLYRNALLFLLADRSALDNLKDAVRGYLAWQSIVSETDQLNLTPLNARLAKRKRDDSEAAVTARLNDAYGWLIVPKQPDPMGPIDLDPIRQQGQGWFAERAGQRLERDGLLNTNWAGSLLRKALDEHLWRDQPHVKVKDLADYFAQYPYLDRLATTDVLLRAIEDGVGNHLGWTRDGFGYADEYDDKEDRYRGLKAGYTGISPRCDDMAVVVRADVASSQLAADEAATATAAHAGRPGQPPPNEAAGSSGEAAGTAAASSDGPNDRPVVQRRFYGSKGLDPLRVGKEAAVIAENIVAFLSTADGAHVEVRLEIEATRPAGFDESTMRTVLENCRTLRFGASEFASE